MSTHALHLTKQSVKAEVDILPCLSLQNLTFQLFLQEVQSTNWTLESPFFVFYFQFVSCHASSCLNLQRQHFYSSALFLLYSLEWTISTQIYIGCFTVLCTFFFFFLRMQKLFTIFNFQTFSSLPSTVSVKRICSFGDWAKTHSCKLPDWLCAILLTIARLLCADTQHVMYFTFNTASNSGSILPSTSFSGAHASSSEECR